MGYSSKNGDTESSLPVLIVISPTGKSLLRASPTNYSGDGQEVHDMILKKIDNNTTRAYYFGSFQSSLNDNATSSALFGRVDLRAEMIPEFEGFGAVVDEASAKEPASATLPNGKNNEHTNISGLIVGGLAGLSFLIVAATVISMMQSRRNADEQ